MLQQPHSLLLNQLAHHITQHHPHRIEPLIRRTDIRQPNIIQKDLLHNEDSDRLAELGARLHYPQAERDDFGGEKEVDDIGGIVLDEGADDAEGGEAEVFEWAGFGGRV